MPALSRRGVTSCSSTRGPAASCARPERPPTRAAARALRGTEPVPVAVAVSVSPRLPGLLGLAGWREISGARPVVALPGAGATADALRAGGLAVEDVAVLGAAQGRPDDVVLLGTAEELAGVAAV